MPKTGRAAFEFLRIEQRAEGLVYVASPGGRPPTEFPMADIGEDFVLFANPQHDFPKSIRYERDAQGRLHARVSADPAGEQAGEEWVWTRQP